jgi:hypothetical protein
MWRALDAKGRAMHFDTAVHAVREWLATYPSRAG